MSDTAPVAASTAVPAESPLVEGMEKLAVEGEEPEEEGLTLRALVSSKEAGVIIGRGGATIATMRSETNVKAGVSKVVPGIADRILSVGGSVEGVAQAYSIVAQTILDNPVQNQDGVAPPAATSTTVRLLISHLLIGSVIGKGGVKIRQIQDVSGARMVASKEMLPQSTERIVEVSGASEAIRLAIVEIAKCLVEDWERSQGTVLYHPGADMNGNGFSAQGGAGFGGRRISASGPQGGFSATGNRRTSSGEGFSAPRNGTDPLVRRAPAAAEGAASTDPNYREQKISIPADMVGCIIGRGGTKINEIRRLSGSKISIAKTAHDDTGERMFVISGLPENNEKALFLLYNQLESEKERRVQSVAEDGAEEA